MEGDQCHSKDGADSVGSSVLQGETRGSPETLTRPTRHRLDLFFGKFFSFLACGGGRGRSRLRSLSLFVVDLTSEKRWTVLSSSVLRIT